MLNLKFIITILIILTIPNILGSYLGQVCVSNEVEGICVRSSECKLSGGQVGKVKSYGLTNGFNPCPNFKDKEQIVCCVKILSKLSNGSENKGICLNTESCKLKFEKYIKDNKSISIINRYKNFDTKYYNKIFATNKYSIPYPNECPSYDIAMFCPSPIAEIKLKDIITTKTTMTTPKTTTTTTTTTTKTTTKTTTTTKRKTTTTTTTTTTTRTISRTTPTVTPNYSCNGYYCSVYMTMMSVSEKTYFMEDHPSFDLDKYQNVIINIGVNNGTAIRKDEKYEEFYKYFKEKGARIGYSFKGRAKTCEEAKKEADEIVSFSYDLWTNSYRKPELPIFYEIMSRANVYDGLTKEQRTEIVLCWADRLHFHYYRKYGINIDVDDLGNIIDYKPERYGSIWVRRGTPYTYPYYIDAVDRGNNNGFTHYGCAECNESWCYTDFNR